jgi:hypothetical protein
MANRISHASGPNEGRESNQTLASQSIFGRIRSAYEREMTTVDPQSDLPLTNREEIQRPSVRGREPIPLLQSVPLSEAALFTY